MKKMANIVCGVAVNVVLVVWVVVDSDIAVALTLQELTHEIRCLLEITLAISRGVICAGEPSLELGGIWSMICPAARPTSCCREIV